MNESEQIVSLMRQTSGLFKSVSKLLRTSDDQIATHGWACKQSKAIDPAVAIERSHEWLPQEAFRFYVTAQHPHLLGYVAVLLWDREKDSLREPLVSGGCLDYGRGNSVGNNWQYFYSRLHLAHPQPAGDGTVVRSRVADMIGIQFPVPFQSLESFAVTLVSITDAEQAENQIGKPLAKILQRATDQAL